jgi:hypothetical protein
MNTPASLDPRVPWARKVSLLEEARKVERPAARQRALESAGKKLGDVLRSQPKVVSVRTLPTSAAPYPTQFAFNGSVPELVPPGLLLIQNRSLLVQVESEQGLKNVLFNPTDGPANQAAPFYRRLTDRAPGFLARRLRPAPNRCAAQLAQLGLSCADIDVIAFDHFHTQDLRPLLGSAGQLGRFPNAVLLAPRIEWEDWDDLPMLQRAWFVPDGKAGVPSERVILFDADVSLGAGLMLVRTPGHTRGNQTLFVHAEQGVFGSSENGTCVDNWAPRTSRIASVRRAAETLDLDVIVNSNTPELMVEQQSSMMLERAIVDRVPGREELFQMFPSSEVTWSLLAPHVRPSYVFGGMTSGTVSTVARALKAQPSASALTA